MSAQPAGTIAYTYLPQYLAIGEDGTGHILIVDTRPGENSGCIIEFMGDATDHSGIGWHSIEHMLIDVEHALTTSTPSGLWKPMIEGGELMWDL